MIGLQSRMSQPAQRCAYESGIVSMARRKRKDELEAAWWQEHSELAAGPAASAPVSPAATRRDEQNRAGGALSFRLGGTWAASADMQGSSASMCGHWQQLGQHCAYHPPAGACPRRSETALSNMHLLNCGRSGALHLQVVTIFWVALGVEGQTQHAPRRQPGQLAAAREHVQDGGPCCGTPAGAHGARDFRHILEGKRENVHLLKVLKCSDLIRQAVHAGARRQELMGRKILQSRRANESNCG